MPATSNRGINLEGLAGIINALDYGVVGDGVTDDAPTLLNILKYANGQMVVVPPGTYWLNSNVTVPNGIMLWLLPGVTLTGPGTLSASPGALVDLRSTTFSVGMLTALSNGNGSPIFLGRTTSLTNTFDPAVVEIDCRTTAGGYPTANGWGTNVAGMWIIGDSFNTAALLKFHRTGTGPIWYVSNINTFQFSYQDNSPIGSYQFITSVTQNGPPAVVRMQISAGQSLETGYVTTYGQLQARRGSSAQTADVFQAQNQTGTALVRITPLGSLVIGTAALATTATDGFVYLPTMAGAPTGTPTGQTGTAPCVIDTTNSKLWVYLGGAWKGVALA